MPDKKQHKMISDLYSTFLSRQGWAKVGCPTILASAALVMCLLLLALLADEQHNIAVSEPQDTTLALPTETPAIVVPTATNTPRLYTVEYQLSVNDAANRSTVQFWFTNSDGRNQTMSRVIYSRQPYTTSVQINPGTSVQLSGVITGSRPGELTCRIIIEGEVVNQTTGHGDGAGVYCSAIAHRQ